MDTVGTTWANRYAPAAPDHVREKAAELYDNYVEAMPVTTFARTTPPSIAAASGAAALLAPWRNPRAVIIGDDDDDE